MGATWIKHGIDDDGDTLLIREKFVEFISHLCLATGGSSFHKSPLSGDSTRDNVSIFLSPADEKNVVVVVELAWGLSRRTIAISLFRVWSDLVSILRWQTVTFADKTSGSQNHRPLETPSPP